MSQFPLMSPPETKEDRTHIAGKGFLMGMALEALAGGIVILIYVICAPGCSNAPWWWSWIYTTIQSIVFPLFLFETALFAPLNLVPYLFLIVALAYFPVMVTLMSILHQEKREKALIITICIAAFPLIITIAMRIMEIALG